MQTASTALTTALNNGYALTALPKLLVEWNQNRYAGILKVDNDPSDDSVGADVENFPITSIAEPQRPTKGVLKARCSKESVRPLKWTRAQIRNGEEGFTAEDFSDEPTAQRYYTTGPDSAYKYWTSPAPTTYTQNVNGSYPFPAGYEVRPYILYKEDAKVNKIVITFDTGWARPVDYDIQTTSNGGATWTTVAKNLVPDSKGQVIIYRSTTSSWSTTIKRDSIGTINGVKLVVKSLNYPDAHLNLIELSARLESDLSDYVTQYDTDMSMSEPNFITPLGKASSNTSNVTLSNMDGLFNNDNPASIYYGLIDKNALMSLDLEYNLGGGVLERIREFTMYTDQWSGQNELELTATCKDSSKFFQEIKSPPLLLENITVGEAIWRICDAIGFTNFVYERKSTDPTATLRYFWTDAEDTVWDTFQKLAEATQCAIYFDEFDVLRVRTREAAYDLTKTPSWALEATNAGGKLADVESAEIVADYEANIVNINYKDTKVSDDNKGFPQMHVLWQPEDTFVLRSSQLSEYLSSTAMVMRIDPSEVKTWPYEGTVNIEGELIKYKGKEYSYYSKTGVLTTVWVNSNDEKLNIDKTLADEAQSYKSTFTGRLTITERGVYWSSPRDHTVDINGWIGRRTLQDSTTVTVTNGGISQNKNESYMKLTAGSTNGPGNVYTATRGNEVDAPYRRYGTRLRIPTAGQGRGTTGLVAFAGANDSGYFIEMIRSEILNDQAGAGRKAHHEINLFVRYPDGTIGRPAGLGSPFVVAKDKWYDLDVDIELASGGAIHNIVVYVDGVARIKASLSSGRATPTGRFGVFVRGHSNADFEYMYAHSGGEEYRTDEVSQFDKVRGGFVSGQWDREYVYGTRDANRKVGKNTVAYKQKYNQYFFDEFGAIVHEVREMDVTFEKFPALHSRLYVTNDSQIVTPEYNANPFGAKFMLANASRNNAVGNGEDELRFGKDASVNQQMMIYGRLVFQEENQLVTVKNDKGKDINPYQNDDSIRRRGKVEVDIDSKWIQSKAEAEALGNWILKHWSGGNDEVNVEVFGNPLFQLGDVVTLDYPDKNIYRTTHRYFVVDIKNQFEKGLSTSLTLRRAKI